MQKENIKVFFIMQKSQIQNILIQIISNLNPIILIPGLIGSQIEIKRENAKLPLFYCNSNNDWFIDYVNLLSFTPIKISCLLYDFDITYDPVMNSQSNNPGIHLRPYDFGGVQGIESFYTTPPLKQYLGQFYNLIVKLKSIGYKLGYNLQGAPQDWRLTGVEHSIDNHEDDKIGGYYSKLKHLIDTSVINTNKKAIIISHSLGGPTFNYFLNNQVNSTWINDHILKFIPISQPWDGGMTQMRAQMQGYTAPFLPRDYLKPIQTRSPVGLWFSPSNPWAKVQVDGKEYSSDNQEEFLNDFGNIQALNLFKVYRNNHGLVKDVSVINKNVKYHVIQSNGWSTEKIFKISRKNLENESKEESEQGDGDGFVNIESLEQFMNLDQKDNVKSYIIENTHHFEIIKSSKVIDLIINIIDEKNYLND